MGRFILGCMATLRRPAAASLAAPPTPSPSASQPLQSGPLASWEDSRRVGTVLGFCIRSSSAALDVTVPLPPSAAAAAAQHCRRGRLAAAALLPLLLPKDAAQRRAAGGPSIPSAGAIDVACPADARYEMALGHSEGLVRCLLGAGVRSLRAWTTCRLWDTTTAPPQVCNALTGMLMAHLTCKQAIKPSSPRTPCFAHPQQGRRKSSHAALRGLQIA